MTWYEISISHNGEDVVTISGRTELIKAVEFLDTSAKSGSIPGTDSVRLYDEVHVAGELLAQLLNHLNQDTSWVLPDETYNVYLSEV